MDQELRYHEIAVERKPEFVARGYKGKHFFPHRCLYLPYALPEQKQVGARVWSLDDRAELFSLLMYGDEQWIGKFPEELFLDPDVMIHREHHGRPGLVASAHLYVDGDRLYTDEHQSDLVQRIHLRREHKSQIEKRFGTWHHMLLNSILHFAVMKGSSEIHVPSAQRVINQYIGRQVNPGLFTRLYNDNINRHFDAKPNGDTWVIDVPQHRDKLVPLEQKAQPIEKAGPTACIVHDLESTTPKAIASLDRVLQQEKALGVRATYNLPPALIPLHQRRIEEAGHAVGFLGHHAVPYRYRFKPTENESALMTQLTRLIRRLDYTARRVLSIQPGPVPTLTELRARFANRIRRAVGLQQRLDLLNDYREVEYYVKGYRLTAYDRDAGMTDARLLLHHFEWLIDGGDTTHAGFVDDRGLMKFPIAIDLAANGRGQCDWISLKPSVEQAIERYHLVTLNVPIGEDEAWLESYGQILEGLRSMAEFKTIQAVTDAYRLGRAV